MASTRTITAYESAVGEGFRLEPSDGTGPGYARGIAVCGRSSLNGRDYPDDVRDRDKAVYENAQVYIDHMVGERKVREWFGELQNVRTRVSDRKTIADHHYPKQSNFTLEYEERAEKFPRSLGFSHVAVCEMGRGKGGREVVEGIKRVESVDLVARPATNTGIHESHRIKPMKLQAYCESIAVKFPATAKKLKALREEFPADPDMPADAPLVDDADTADDPVKSAFSQAMHSLVDQFDSGDIEGGALIAKLKTLMKAAEKMGDGGAEITDDEPAIESARTIARLTVENIALRTGVELSDLQKRAVLGMSDEADRKTLIESFRAAAHGERPKSQGRSSPAPKPAETVSESQSEASRFSWYDPEAA